jgi:hypothetical protein
MTPLVQMWALIALLWQRPSTPLTRRRKLFFRIAAAGIALVAIAAGVVFAVATFSESDPWGRWVTACFTFGLFGLPSSIVAIVAGAIISRGSTSKDTAYALCAIFLAVSYFAQWLLLSAALLRRSMSRAAMHDLSQAHGANH